MPPDDTINTDGQQHRYAPRSTISTTRLTNGGVDNTRGAERQPGTATHDEVGNALEIFKAEARQSCIERHVGADRDDVGVVREDQALGRVGGAMHLDLGNRLPLEYLGGHKIAGREPGDKIVERWLGSAA